MKRDRLYCEPSEKGAALILILVIMMSLTVLGVGVIISTSTNLSLSRNFEVATQAQNMADIGAKVAYREFINSGYLQTTHTEDAAGQQTGDDLLPTELSYYSIDDDGYITWEWDDSQPYDPLFDTDRPHGFKFRVYYTTDKAWVIEAEGWYGTIHRRTRAKGEIEAMFQFSYFASRDLGEFVRGASQEIRGKVHANGTMFVRPSGSSLYINTDSFTSTGPIIRSRDAWGRPDASGNCYISKDFQDSGNWVKMESGSPRGSEGVAFDSFHPDWTDKVIGDRAKWGGVVRDYVPVKSPPPIQGLDPGGYYNQLADDGGLVITQSTHAYEWCDKVTSFYNYNEDRYQTIWDIDIGKLMSMSYVDSVTFTESSGNTIYIKGNHADRISSNDTIEVFNSSTAGLNGQYTVDSAADVGDSTQVVVDEEVEDEAVDGIVYLIGAGDWPSNNLIYCLVPVRISNAAELQNRLMVASCRNVYTKGDFNTVNKKGASIMTRHRIYHLSDNWSDAYTPSTSKNSRVAKNTTINAALVDGAPTVDEYNWCDRDGDNHYDYNNGVMYSPESPKTAAGYHNPYNSGNPWANCDDLIENWSGKTLTKFGSVVHLGTSYDIMCPNLDNSGITDDELAWVRKTGYRPPARNYLYDPDLATPSGQPPFTPLIGHITSWEPY
ncbi:MAG: pilus assembly PilX N-terminal domain-containing protein [Candidatus Latescibacteria bacterium]|nr:pilus assembly PilX N-terminal domain-containing protein [Candidatus Latescibacterota bacterium]